MRPEGRTKEAFYLLYFMAQGAIMEEELLSFVLSLRRDERENWCRVAPMLYLGTVSQKVQRIADLCSID